MHRIIEVIVTVKGETSIQTRGYVGSDCLQASKFLEEALGAVTQEVKTSDFYAAASAAQHIEQQ